MAARSRSRSCTSRRKAPIANRFRNEAIALGRLAHPAVVGYVDHGELDDGRPFLAMEWIVGESLSSGLRASLCVGQTFDVTRQLLSGSLPPTRAGSSTVT